MFNSSDFLFRDTREIPESIGGMKRFAGDGERNWGYNHRCREHQRRKSAGRRFSDQTEPVLLFRICHNVFPPGALFGPFMAPFRAFRFF
ncbi:MAG: hypothetical protein LBR00_03980 [Clostridiales Family XIII bacterium]|nr:hypothetical protein [Clostridiales Family XIII bacterium]